MRIPVISPDGGYTQMKYMDEKETVLNNENRDLGIKIFIKYKDIEKDNYLAKFESDPETSDGFRIVSQDKV